MAITLLLVLSIVLNLLLAFMLKKSNNKLTELKVKYKSIQEYAERIAGNYLEYVKKHKDNSKR